MTDPAQHLLVLTYPVALEDELVDWLLVRREAGEHFTTWHVGGRGRRVTLRGSAEQVRGYGQYGRAEVVAEVAQIGTLLEDLRRDLPGRGITCWSVPLAAFGRIE